MGANLFSLGRILRLVGVALLVMITNVVISIIYMIVYSYAIDPGHGQGYYESHIQVAAPYCSIVAGIPLMFLAGWWVSKWWNGEFGVKPALFVWLTYAVIDITMMIGSGSMTASLAVLVVVSVLTKLAAAYAGARFALASQTR